MNNKQELKTEILLVSRYCEIIMQIISVHKQLSINKPILFAYLLKDKHNYLKAVYNGNNTTNVVIKAISLLSGKFNEYCLHIKYIIEAMHLLIANGDILLQKDILLYSDGTKKAKPYNDMFIKRAIEESSNFSDRQFLKEVMNNV